MNAHVKTVVLFGVLSAVLVALGGAVAPNAVYVFVGLAVVLNLGAYFFSDRLVLRLHRARPLARDEFPHLHVAAAELAARAGIPTPRLFLIPAPYANAFATGRTPARGVVAVSEGLLRELDPRQVRGVLAHEIAHIRNRDVLLASMAAALAAAIAYIANAVQFTAIFGGQSQDRGHGGGLVAALVAPLAATLVQLAISRSREYVADETAARLTGDAEALASALERLSVSAARQPAEIEPATASLFIVNPLAAGGVAGFFSTHPPVSERIRRLRTSAWRRAA
jgi:heat shock protein HtpX